MRRRLLAVLFVVLAATAVLATIATPADARRLPPLIGCDSLLNWPCPGPVLVNP